MQSIDSAPKDGSPVWAEVCTLKENVFRTWIYWSSGAAKWAYASHPYDFPRDVHGWLPIAINQTMQFPPLTPESQSVLKVADNLHSPLPPPTLEEMQQALQELENWQQAQSTARPSTEVPIGNRLEVLRRGIAHYCHD